MSEVLPPVLTMGLLGFVLAYGLFLAYKKLRVDIDPKVGQVAEALPQANCGACGFAGCEPFAEAVVTGGAETTGCPVGGAGVAEEIAAILGVEAASVVKKVARVHCRGTWEAAAARGSYMGLLNCAAAHLVGGNKQCAHGCVGLGDCVRACPFDAMAMQENGLPVVFEEKCTACGKCVEACPRNIMELHPLVEDVLVFCRSLDGPKASRKACKNACIACNICVRAFPGAVVMENNLAKVIDWNRIERDRLAELKKCPTDAIGLVPVPLEEKRDEDEGQRNGPGRQP